MKKTLVLLATCFTIIHCGVTFAQDDGSTRQKAEQALEQSNANKKTLDKLKNLKVSGYIQTDFLYGEPNASFKVGSDVKQEDNQFRFGVRRGRIKFDHGTALGNAVFQLDLTEKGISFKDVYYKLNDPFFGGWISLKAGIFDRPFGYEISYSSRKRESPERSTITTTLFPDERDLGTMLTLQAPKDHSLHFLKLEAGIFAGNGIKKDFHNSKDFIAHLSASKKISDKFSLGGGFSTYIGNVQSADTLAYEMDGKSFAESKVKEGDLFARQYFGIDAQLSLDWIAGVTSLRGEYLFGKQPAVSGNSKSPNSGTVGSGSTYIRNFNGGYVYFIQNIAHSKHSLVFKYDFYDPNTSIASNEIGNPVNTKTGKGDIGFNSIGVGYLLNLNSAMRIMAYYEMKSNETSTALDGYKENIKDNIFTLRLQYTF